MKNIEALLTDIRNNQAKNIEFFSSEPLPVTSPTFKN